MLKAYLLIAILIASPVMAKEICYIGSKGKDRGATCHCPNGMTKVWDHNFYVYGENGGIRETEPMFNCIAPPSEAVTAAPVNPTPQPIVPRSVGDECIKVGFSRPMMACKNGFEYSTSISATHALGCPAHPSYTYAPNDSYSYDVGVPLYTCGLPDQRAIRAAP